MIKSKNKKILQIKAERIKRGWTQSELAFFAGVNAADVSRIEAGRMSNPYPNHAQRLARVLGIAPEELTKEVEPEGDAAEQL